MSFFSHNPEAWDEIERKGVAEYLAGHMQDDDLLEDLAEALTELQLAAESHEVWKQLTKLAGKEIGSGERQFFEDMAGRYV